MTDQTMTHAPVTEQRPVMPALTRGWQRKCPSCGNGRLLKGYLKVNDTCPVCQQELHHHRAGPHSVHRAIAETPDATATGARRSTSGRSDDVDRHPRLLTGQKLRRPVSSTRSCPVSSSPTTTSRR